MFSRGAELTIDNSSISGNKAGYFGGGIANSGGPLAINRTTISENRALSGGGLFSLFGSYGSLAITNSTISDNRANQFGGGMEIISGDNVSLENSTISGNRAGSGGGMRITGQAAVSIEDSTITGNNARSGGGVDNLDGRVTLNRSLVSGNEAHFGTEIYSFNINNGTIAADDFNLFGNDGNAGIVGFAPGTSDIIPGAGIELASILSPLADNGGPALTHALVPGSPALDAVPGTHPSCTGTDQRGVARPQGPHCDIGAFERDAP